MVAEGTGGEKLREAPPLLSGPSLKISATMEWQKPRAGTYSAHE